MKTKAEQKCDERRAKRAAGYVLKQLWILPSKWVQIRRYIARVQR